MIKCLVGENAVQPGKGREGTCRGSSDFRDRRKRGGSGDDEARIRIAKDFLLGFGELDEFKVEDHRRLVLREVGGHPDEAPLRANATEWPGEFQLNLDVAIEREELFNGCGDQDLQGEADAGGSDTRDAGVEPAGEAVGRRAHVSHGGLVAVGSVGRDLPKAEHGESPCRGWIVTERAFIHRCQQAPEKAGFS